MKNEDINSCVYTLIQLPYKFQMLICLYLHTELLHTDAYSLSGINCSHTVHIWCGITQIVECANGVFVYKFLKLLSPTMGLYFR